MLNAHSIPGVKTATAQAEQSDDADDQDGLDLASRIHQMVLDQLWEFANEAHELRNEGEPVDMRPARRR